VNERANGADRPLVRIDGLAVDASSRSSVVHAVRNLRVSIRRGEALGIIGESGSGKSTTVAALLGLLGPNRRIVGGTIEFDGELVYGPGVDRRAEIRGHRVGLVFQAAAASLNPMRRVSSQFRELLKIHRDLSGDAAEAVMVELLQHLGFERPDTVLRAYPHQLSGGMAQRVALALALAGEPDLLIADEATSALDVLTQATVVRLLRRLVDDDGYSLIFVTHDIALAADVCDVLLVMKDGEVVDHGPAAELIATAQNPYTRTLIDAVPLIGTTDDAVPGVPSA